MSAEELADGVVRAVRGDMLQVDCADINILGTLKDNSTTYTVTVFAQLERRGKRDRPPDGCHLCRQSLYFIEKQKLV